jgi:hypothetical protein
MAEFIMKKMVADRGIADKFVIESAAHTSEEIGNPVYPPGITWDILRGEARQEDDERGL